MNSYKDAEQIAKLKKASIRGRSQFNDAELKKQLVCQQVGNLMRSDTEFGRGDFETVAPQISLEKQNLLSEIEDINQEE